MTLSEKQLLANRRNADSSTGPRTPEGKAAVSRNALAHGLTAAALAPRRLRRPRPLRPPPFP
jgi:hypothetical protein